MLSAPELFSSSCGSSVAVSFDELMKGSRCGSSYSWLATIWAVKCRTIIAVRRELLSPTVIQCNDWCPGMIASI